MIQLNLTDSQKISGFDIPHKMTDKTQAQKTANSKKVNLRECNSSKRGSITEIFLSYGQSANMQLLLPMMTQLANNQRWLAWIDPPSELKQRWQNSSGIDPSRIIILRSSTEKSAFSLAEQALSTGTSETVIVWDLGLSAKQIECLEVASEKGKSHCILLRMR